MIRRRRSPGRKQHYGVRSWATLLVILGLLLANCGAPDVPDGQTNASAAPQQQTGLEDGFWRDDALSEPIEETILALPSPEDDGEMATAKLQILSLDSDGEFVRLVMAWLVPDDGIPLGSIVLSSHEHRYEATPFIRLVDRDANELIEPLRGDTNTFSYEDPPQIEETLEHADAETDNDGQSQGESPTSSAPDVVVPDRGTCICSMLSGAEEDPPVRTELIYVDFPMPLSESVDIIPGEWAEPIRDIPVSEGEAFERSADGASWFFTHVSGEDPPDQYGSGARYAVRYPISARTETLSGVTTTIEEETQEVSLPADVLFEFGSADLADEADDIIESAAEKLNEEAAGLTVTVEGHTDNVGSAELNEKLSEDRAEAVADVMEEHLDDSIDLETVGYGFTRPQVPNLDAEDEPIPENQARNRRVSFRYPEVIQEGGVEIDLGQGGVEDLPSAREIEPADGATASFVFGAPEGDTSETDVRLDLLEAEREGDLVTMRFALSSAPAERHSGTVFTGNPEIGGSQHFGKNPQGDGDSPGLANMSLIDVGTERRYFPLGSGDMGCLCTEVAGSVETLPVEKSPLYAQFNLPEDFDGPVILHLPDAGQFTLPEEVLVQMETAIDSNTDDE